MRRGEWKRANRPCGVVLKVSLTPSQVARAINVSESSVKRWCDKGMIVARHTAGGHRRIHVSDLLAFLRRKGMELVHPEILGVPQLLGKTSQALGAASEQLTSFLLDGDEQSCRQLAIDLYLSEHSLGAISDEVLAKAFRCIGNCWAAGEAEVFQERRGIEIASRMVHELRALIPRPPVDAPLAIGGSPSGDQYTLPTNLVELVLQDVKWNATSLGPNLPFETMRTAILELRPKLFWLSCSYLENEVEFLSMYQELHEEFSSNVAFVVGGFALSEEVRNKMKFSAYCTIMQHLEGFAETLRGAIFNQ